MLLNTQASKLANLTSSLLGQLDIAAVPSSMTLAACAAISKNTGALTQTYPTAPKQVWWSNTDSDLVPACIVFPRSTDDVAAVVRILGAYPMVPFATKSGGHNPNAGFSSVQSGVLISLSWMNSTALSSDKKTAVVMPGARWADPIMALEPYNVTVVGGRLGDVGVGGLLLGCGLSFMSPQYGLPCDSVVNYEVVLSDGSVVNADATCNSDLFWALHGGGNQFGIVTKFTLRTYPIGQIWGGVRIYDRSAATAILLATQDYTVNFRDPKASVIVTNQIIADNLSQFWAVFMFYDGPTPPQGIFDKFNAIASTKDDVKTQSYSALMNANAKFGSIYNLRYFFRGSTVPNLSGINGSNLLMENFANFQTYTTKALALKLDMIANFIYQPIPVAIPAASAAINPTGNVLGLNANNGDHMWMAVTVSGLTALEDGYAAQLATDIINNMVSYTQTEYAGAQSSNSRNTDNSGQYSPQVFMNDAMADQHVLQGYGSDTFQRLQSIQKAYDPMGLFFSRTGGFRT